MIARIEHRSKNNKLSRDNFSIIESQQYLNDSNETEVLTNTKY